MGFINDGINSFFSSAQNKISEVTTGINPATNPVFGELFGFNVPGIPIIGSRDYFLTNMESWISALPMRTQWIVLVEHFPAALNTGVMQHLENIGGDGKGYDIDKAVSMMTSFPNQKINGCIFAQGVNIPNEIYNVQDISVPNNRGFLPGVIGSNRQGYAGKQLTVEFRETNLSFMDFIIRPWVILGSHYGYVARGPSAQEQMKNIKTNLIILQFAKTYQNISMVPRKVWKFYNCAPTEVAAQNLAYSGEGMDILDTKWTYSHYTVENNLYIPIPDLIDKIRNFSFKNSAKTLFPSL